MKTERTLTEKTIFTALTFNTPEYKLEETLTRAPFLLTAQEAIKAIQDFKTKYPDYPIVGTTTGVTGRENVQSVKKTRKKHEHTPSALVRAATKEFALAVSGKKKNGKFRRVGKKFIQTIETDLENLVRDIGVRNKHSEDDIPGDWDFVNHLRIWPKVSEQLNRAIRRRIFERVMSQPSIGKTLK